MADEELAEVQATEAAPQVEEAPEADKQPEGETGLSLNELLERRLQEAMAAAEAKVQALLQDWQARQEMERYLREIEEMEPEEIGRRIKERLRQMAPTAPSQPPVPPPGILGMPRVDVQEIARVAQKYEELKAPPAEDIPKLQEIIRTAPSTGEAIERLVAYVHQVREAKRRAEAEQKAARLQATAQAHQQQAMTQAPSVAATAQPAGQPMSLAELMVRRMRESK